MRVRCPRTVPLYVAPISMRHIAAWGGRGGYLEVVATVTSYYIYDYRKKKFDVVVV